MFCDNDEFRKQVHPLKNNLETGFEKINRSMKH